MHYSIGCYVAKALFTSEVSDHSTQAIHGWHVAKTRFVTLLSTKVLNSLEKLSCCPTSIQLLWLLQLYAKSEHSLVCIVLQDLRHL